MKRAKKAKKRQANSLTTPGMGIAQGLFIGAAIGKFVMKAIIDAFDTDAIEQARNNPEVRIEMGQFFDSMNAFIPVLISGRHRKIISVRPSAAVQDFSPRIRSRAPRT